MTFDPVHDTQRAFRGLLEAVSYPGRVVDLSALAAPWADRFPGADLPPALLLAAATVCDHDSPYATLGGSGLAGALADWCAAPGVSLEIARQVVVDAPDPVFAEALGLVNVGTLADPHRGATVLALCEDLDAGTPMTWTGPGLAGPAVVPVPPGTGWLEVRQRRCAEFPLGFDLWWFDRRGRVRALPRTTRLTPLGGA